MKRYFGDFGEMFVSELLITPLKEVEQAFEKFKKDKKMEQHIATRCWIWNFKKRIRKKNPKTL